MAWEEEKVKLLLELNKQQYSASQIAEKLGGGVTRNAVIGKLNRMGMSCGNGNASNRGGESGKKRLPADASGVPQKSKGRAGIRLVPKWQPAEKPVGIADLSDSDCRFPMGDPDDKDFRFCGAAKGHEDLPYCDYHTQLAHQRSKRLTAKVEKGAQKQPKRAAS